MNTWILEKLMSYLTAKEGFTVAEEAEAVINGRKAILQDVFGYRYEIQVKILGRTHNEDDTNVDLDMGSFKTTGLTSRLDTKGGN